MTTLLWTIIPNGNKDSKRTAVERVSRNATPYITRTGILLTPFSPNVEKDGVTNNEPIADHLTANKSLSHVMG